MCPKKGSICVCVCVWHIARADTHLSGMRGTAVGVEAAVTTCRICSRADKPPPTWNATWSALFWRREEAERKRERVSHEHSRRGERVEVSHCSCCVRIPFFLSQPPSFKRGLGMTSEKKRSDSQRIPAKCQKRVNIPPLLQSPNPDAGQQIYRPAHKAGVVQPDKQELRGYKGMEIWGKKHHGIKREHYLHNIMLRLAKNTQSRLVSTAAFVSLLTIDKSDKTFKRRSTKLCLKLIWCVWVSLSKRGHKPVI